ncbi:MAG: PLP-dependent aminotransferase family protein [Clostridiales Family XIII bacterium]|jgi:DNA-binding transcriptional MocR family regulator|nr:PLP-dependent aminotransferase family protein [Clostridiales Family XIII bacterium]
MNIKISKGHQTPVFRQVANQIREAILCGELREGSFLPSEREMAGMTGLHRNTVARVYQELGCEGYLEAIRGRGHIVSFQTEKSDETPFPNAGNTDGEGRLERKYPGVPWFALMRNELVDCKSAFDDLFSKSCAGRNISFASGLVPPEAYFEEDIKEILNELTKSGNENIFNYSHHQGLHALRSGLCSMFRMKGIDVSPSEILVVNETNQALDYLAELFTEKGDTVITESPTSPDVYRAFMLRGATVLSVPMERDGANIDMMKTLVERRRPKFICVSSGFHDPTGIVMSREKRTRLLELSYRHMIPIIEEDSSSEINFTEERIPSIKAMDKNGNTVYIYSMALTFAPGFKMAFVLGNKQVVKKLSYLQSMHIMNPDNINQSIIAHCIKKGLYMKNTHKIRELYREKALLLSECLSEARSLGLRFDEPKGGVYLWCRLPETADFKRFQNDLTRRGVYIMPGSLFFPEGTTGSDYMRLNYSRPDRDQIKKGARILTETLRTSLR